MKTKAVVFAVVGILLFSACARPTFVACRDEAVVDTGEFKWSARKAEIGCERAVLTVAATYDKEKGTWELKRDLVTTEDVKKLLTDRAKALDELQRYDDDGLSSHIDWFKGLRAGLEREERATLWILQRIQFVHTYNEFVALVGELPKEMLAKDAEYFFEHGSKNYSMRMIYPARDVTKIPFTARYIEEAKSQGKLQLVDSFTVTDSRRFAEKIPDFKDPNKFTWDKREYGWKILSYKILAGSNDPNDGTVQYIEVFRVDAGTMKVEEGNAALRGFLASGGNNVSVFVVDYDKEGEDGFGSPDAVRKIFKDIVTGRDLYNDENLRSDLLVSLHDRPKSDQTRPERRRPPNPPVYVEIVPMGQKVNIEVWETKDDGWRVPFDYASLYVNLELAYGGPESKEERELKEKYADLKKIKMLLRQFKRSGETVLVEYWQPKEEYSKMDVTYASAGVGSTGIYTIQRKGRTREEAEIEYFASRVKAIDYLYGGLWFRILDENGDGVFEKKRQIANPTKTTNNCSPAIYHDQ